MPITDPSPLLLPSHICRVSAHERIVHEAASILGAIIFPRLIAQPNNIRKWNIPAAWHSKWLSKENLVFFLLSANDHQSWIQHWFFFWWGGLYERLKIQFLRSSNHFIEFFPLFSFLYTSTFPLFIWHKCQSHKNLQVNFLLGNQPCKII